MAAILHDVTEDTAFTSQMLLDLGVPEAAVAIVKLVDRDHSAQEWATTYSGGAMSWPSKDDYYYTMIRSNPGAVQVKLADIGDNMQPWRLSYLPPETQDRLRNKYNRAIQLLTE
jgi:(p)ppGpp synthase/HD superfamily hydrolase